MKKKDLINEWIEYAQRHSPLAEHLTSMIPEPLEIICFHCQQTAEKALKTFLISVFNFSGLTFIPNSRLGSFISRKQHIDCILPVYAGYIVNLLTQRFSAYTQAEGGIKIWTMIVIMDKNPVIRTCFMRYAG